jgi:voltage-gated potassium channel
MSSILLPPEPNSKRQHLWRVIFLSDTRAGRAFDVVLLWLIGLSVLTVVLESVEGFRADYRRALVFAEWAFTLIFTIEYLLRLWVVRRRLRYAGSFFGVVDLISILPSWFELIVPDAHYFMALRVLRLMRMFRILRMVEYVQEAAVLIAALRASRRKIMVFFVSILSLVCVEGTAMYVLERGANSGFNNIPQSIYWAIVTITTVGYGDISPVTVAGKMMASVIMLTGFAIIAVPTGIVTSELGRSMLGASAQRCEACGFAGHPAQAIYCHQCGGRLTPPPVALEE